MFEKYKFIENFRLHAACYLMMDLDPPPDEYNKPPGRTETPTYLFLKDKPVFPAVDAFLKNFLERWHAGAFGDVQVKFEGMKSGINKSGYETIAMILGRELINYRKDPHHQTNPNLFYAIELTRPELKHVADIMGLKPAFLQDPESEASEAEPQKTPDIFPIETPPGTTWKQIYFTVRNYEITEIKHPDGIENKLHKEMGLKQRGKGPLPGILLQLYLSMAALNGTLPAQGNIGVIKGNICRLRQCFKSLFPNISGDPIPFNNNEYQTAFTLQPDPENFFNQMPDATKDYLEAFTKAANRIKSKKILPD